MDDWDKKTRVHLWNTFLRLVDKYQLYREYETLHIRIHVDILHEPYDDLPRYHKPFEMFKEVLLDGDIASAADALQLAVDWSKYLTINSEYFEDFQLSEELAPAFNEVLQDNFVGARFIDNRLVPITSETEIEAIEETLVASDSLEGVQHHLKTALRHLSSREHPDYANCAKESLSAVESLMERLTGKNVLSAALKKLPEGLTVHPAQVAAWQSMYGWAGDEDGVRHSAQTMPTVDQAMAKYTLVTCSAFVNLMITEANKAGLLN